MTKPKDLSRQPDFKNIEINTEDPKEYSWQERRAEIFQIIKKKGYPDLNRSKLGRRYNKTPKQISEDIGVIQQYIAKELDEFKFVSMGKLIMEKGVEEYLKTKEYNEAMKLWNSWKEFLYEDGVREKEPDKTELKHKGIPVTFKDYKETTSE